jgi:hypothetical protein
LSGLDEYINSRMFKDEAGVWVCGFCGKTSGPKTNIRNHIGKLAEKQCSISGSVFSHKYGSGCESGFGSFPFLIKSVDRTTIKVAK